MTFRFGRTARNATATALLARHRAMIAGDIAEAILQSVSGHLNGNQCDPLQACNVCARSRQAKYDAAVARRIGGVS